jgi:hypothetical protein
MFEMTDEQFDLMVDHLAKPAQRAMKARGYLAVTWFPGAVIVNGKREEVHHACGARCRSSRPALASAAIGAGRTAKVVANPSASVVAVSGVNGAENVIAIPETPTVVPTGGAVTHAWTWLRWASCPDKGAAPDDSDTTCAAPPPRIHTVTEGRSYGGEPVACGEPAPGHEQRTQAQSTTGEARRRAARA